ncbi:MAG: DUF2760 domain-containing protein [Planctomycetota bacterium]|nr:DUF2760 domain-containing protein [Planctomycetota bacterium]MDA1177614.1 DUF2760 domain-containing protein [Planctomycetota bacterium]
MRRFFVAIRAMFATLFGSVSIDTMERTLIESVAAKRALAGKGAIPSLPSLTEDHPPASTTPNQEKVSTKPASRRNDAISLLAALQREARWLDLVQENLDAYSDAQVGAAARTVLRGCQDVLRRTLDLKPVVAFEEGAEVETPTVIDAARWQLSGRVTGSPPYRGRLIHHGWEASRLELPQWSGAKESSLIIAPAEIEVP